MILAFLRTIQVVLQLKPEFEHIDSGNDHLLNRTICNASKGEKRYPKKVFGKEDI